MIRYITPLLLGSLLSTHALASDDLEYQDLEEKEKETKKLEVTGSFQAQWHEFNNIDFRQLDETSDQSILDSDDRSSLAFTGVNLGIDYTIDKKVRMVLGASHRGLWGNDQFGGSNDFGGWMYFTSLYVDYAPWGADKVNIRIGRQPFEIGGMNRVRDYVLADIVDMVRVDVPIAGVGTLTAVPVEVFSSFGDNDDATFARYIAQSAVPTFNFRGDTMTRRHGLMFNLNELNIPVDSLAYFYYTDIGALGTGADITYDGNLGNFADNDWVGNYGLRLQAEFGPVQPYASLDGSFGVDRKELVARDANTNGFAFGGGVRLKLGDEKKGFDADVRYFESQGPVYAQDGLMNSHGYVGMKGRHIGGTLTNRYLGWHPTSYVGLFGVSNTANAVDRKSGTRVIHAGAGYRGLGPVSFDAGWWLVQDTGVTFLNLEEVDTIDPPFGYSREEFRAQERAGKLLGNEFNLNVQAAATDHLSFELGTALFLPGPYYAIPINRVAGDQLGGETPTWSVNAGTQVKF
jgi:hypothetical protein